MEKLSDLYRTSKHVDLQNKIIMEGVVDYNTESEITEIVKIVYGIKRKTLSEYADLYSKDFER